MVTIFIYIKISFSIIYFSIVSYNVMCTTLIFSVLCVCHMLSCFCLHVTCFLSMASCSTLMFLVFFSNLEALISFDFTLIFAKNLAWLTLIICNNGCHCDISIYCKVSHSPCLVGKRKKKV